MAYKYPNLAAEMSRNGYDYGELYRDMAGQFNRSTDSLSNWITGRAGDLPTSVAFAIRDQYFPGCSIDYLFSETPMTVADAQR